MLRGIFLFPIVAGLSLVESHLALADTIKLTKSPSSSATTSQTPVLDLGKVEVALPPCNGTNEFLTQWKKQLVFIEAPPSICVRWTENKPIDWNATASSKWDMLKLSKSTPVTLSSVGTGGFPNLSVGETRPNLIFSISLQKAGMPDYNTTSSSQKYEVKIQPDGAGGTTVPALLIQKPKPAPANPYVCVASATANVRKVVIELPNMTVNHTTTTKGDGTRDELFFTVGRKGPNTSSGDHRLPAPDDYFEAFNGKTIGSDGWTNKDQKKVPNPIFWSGKLNDNQSVLLSISALEQDNADEKDIKNFLVGAFKAIAAGFAVAGGPVGAAGTAIAGTAAALSNAFIPATDGQDFIGFMGVNVINHCGYIQLSWLTFKEIKTTAGTISSSFQQINGNGANYMSRLDVIEASQPEWPGVQNPSGLNFDPYSNIGGSTDEFWWTANGTSSSQYTFLLKAMVSTP